MLNSIIYKINYINKMKGLPAEIKPCCVLSYYNPVIQTNLAFYFPSSQNRRPAYISYAKLYVRKRTN